MSVANHEDGSYITSRIKSGVVWECGIEGRIHSDVPLTLELKRPDGTVIVRLLVNPQMLGGSVTGIGAW